MSDPEATVIVVDDDPSVRRSTERLLASMGFDVQTFASAKEFHDRARLDRSACLLLDVHLPGVSGLDLQRELARSRVQLPIIFMTGCGTIPTSAYAMNDAVQFLTKPASPDELNAAIRAAIERGRGLHSKRPGSLRQPHKRLSSPERRSGKTARRSRRAAGRSRP